MPTLDRANQSYTSKGIRWQNHLVIKRPDLDYNVSNWLSCTIGAVALCSRHNHLTLIMGGCSVDCRFPPKVLIQHPLSLTKAVYQLDFEQGPVSPTGTSLFLCHSTLTPQQFTIIGEVHDVIPLDLGVWGWCCTCVGCLLTVAIDHVSGVARTSVWRLVWPHNLCQSPHYFKGDSILWWDSWPLS